MLKTLTILVLCYFVAACSTIHKNNNISAHQQLNHIIQLEQQYRENSSPFNRNEAGGSNAKLPDLSPQQLAKNNQTVTELYQKLAKIKVEKLTLTEQINWSVLHYNLKNELDNYHYKQHYLPLTAESGFHVWISSIASQINMRTEQDYLDYLARLKDLPRYFDQQIAWMNKGIAEGITQPAIVLKGFEQSIKAFIKKDVCKSVYFTPFQHFPSHFSDETKQRFSQQAKKILHQYVMPSYQNYYQYMVNVYQPHARKTIAASLLPNGRDFYQNRVNYYTTQKMSVDHIHQLGLQEVKRIKKAMLAIMQQLNFKGDFAQFIQFLRSDSQFYAKTPRDLLKEAAYIAKKIDGKLPSLFKTLPRKPYGIAPVPKNIAPKYTTGRYSPPRREDQAGFYWVNTYRLDRRPLYVLPALTLHEAVPGHHLQGAIASEMKDVPEFRNNTYISAFGEGWGLYAEYLGEEAGIYENAYQEFGRLTYEMWRACRLVIDTGIHAKGWSRAKAVAFLANNTALSMHNVNTEIDRYISWPGQALSYKIGELTIKRLRKKTEQKLAERFNLREFHDQILKNGSMPLFMLEKVIGQYIDETMKKGKAGTQRSPRE